MSSQQQILACFFSCMIQWMTTHRAMAEHNNIYICTMGLNSILVLQHHTIFTEMDHNVAHIVPAVCVGVPITRIVPWVNKGSNNIRNYMYISMQAAFRIPIDRVSQQTFLLTTAHNRAIQMPADAHELYETDRNAMCLASNTLDDVSESTKYIRDTLYINNDNATKYNWLRGNATTAFKHEDERQHTQYITYLLHRTDYAQILQYSTIKQHLIDTKPCFNRLQRPPLLQLPKCSGFSPKWQQRNEHHHV